MPDTFVESPVSEIDYLEIMRCLVEEKAASLDHHIFNLKGKSLVLRDCSSDFQVLGEWQRPGTRSRELTEVNFSILKQNNEGEFCIECLGTKIILDTPILGTISIHRFNPRGLRSFLRGNPPVTERCEEPISLEWSVKHWKPLLRFLSPELTVDSVIVTIVHDNGDIYLRAEGQIVNIL